MQADPAAGGANNQSFSSGYVTQKWIEMLGSTSDLHCACVHVRVLVLINILATFKEAAKKTLI